MCLTHTYHRIASLLKIPENDYASDRIGIWSLAGSMRYDIRIAAVSWIKADPNPIHLAVEAKLWQPDWIPKVVIGLVATANAPPAHDISDINVFRSTKNYRCLSHARLKFEFDLKTQKIRDLHITEKIQDPGWTPPFDRWKFPTTKIYAPDPSMTDPAFYPGEMSSISKMTVLFKHPNSVITKIGTETVIWNSLTKFRAGPHTDKVGVSSMVGSPFHVPWVWQETLLTVRKDGRLCLYGAGSKFPTLTWFLNGKAVMGQSEISDKSFPHDGRQIIVKAMNIYPALSVGAPASGPQTPFTETQNGPVSGHPHTLSGYQLPSLHVF